MSADVPVLLDVRTGRGIAGSLQVGALVQYPGEAARWVAFYGSTYGGPILMAAGAVQTFVHPDVLDRCGRVLDAGWVRRFFGLEVAA